MARAQQETLCAGAPPASKFLRGADEPSWDYALRVFNLVFSRDIARVASIAALWKSRPPPTPLRAARELLTDAAASPGDDVPADGVVAHLGLNPREVSRVVNQLAWADWRSCVSLVSWATWYVSCSQKGAELHMHALGTRLPSAATQATPPTCAILADVD
jgi:hypothetical protein